MKKIISLTLVFLFLFIRPAKVSLAYAPTQTPACTTATPSADPSATVCVSQVITRADGTSPNNSFTISWLSASSETGQVQIIGGGTFNDTRSASFNGITHYVQVNNLQANTTYQFDILSGGNTFNNSNQHWSVTLGPALPQAAPNKIIGRVKNQDGTDAPDAIVYAAIQRADGSATSALLSQVLTGEDSGSFLDIALGDARTSNYVQQFTFDRSKDKLLLTATGPGGSSSTAVLANVALPPQPSPPNVTLTLGSGLVSVATATPSPIPPTSTLTPISPTVMQTFVPSTATAYAATQTALAITATITRTPATATALPTLVASTLAYTATRARPAITIAPADETQVAPTPSEARAETTRVASPDNAANPARGFDASAILTILAWLAIVAAAVLGIAAFFFWKNNARRP